MKRRRSESEGQRPSRSFNCSKCDWSGTEGRFKRHVQSHSGIFKQCNYCNFQSDRAYYFVSGVMQHNCENRKAAMVYKCPKCEFASTRKGPVGKHMTAHTGVFQSCGHCSFTSDI